MDNFESVTVAKSQPCGPKPKALKAAVAATPKRKREDDEGNIGSAEKNGSSSSREPKKYKRAFGFFVKAKKAEAEKQLGSDYQVFIIEVYII